MTQAIRDQNHVTVALGVSDADSTVTLPFTIDAATGRLLTDAATGSGTVTSVSVVSANGLAGTVATATTTPAITLSTTITGILEGNGTAISAATTIGSGAVVLATSPTLVTPALGTPSALVLTNATGLPVAGLANGTDGELITWDATGVAATVAVGTAGHILTSNGAGAAPTFQDAAGGGANTALSNLAAVAINTSLISDTTNTDDLGSSSILWANLFVTNIGATGTRVTKGWFTDIESTNMPTVGGTAILTSLTAPQFTTIELGHASDTTISRSAAGVLAVEGVVIPSISSTDTLTNKTLTSPTLTTPALGTPASGVMTNVTGLPASAILAGTLATGTYLLSENASIGLDPAGSADGKYTGITVTGVAGYAQTYGDLVYLAAADSRWELADADAATTADRMLAMVVVAGGSDGAACTLLLQGIIRADAKFPALTIGSPVYVGETAGAVQVAIPTGADNIIKRVGFALTADEIYFNPSQDSQVTVA